MMLKSEFISVFLWGQILNFFSYLISNTNQASSSEARASHRKEKAVLSIMDVRKRHFLHITSASEDSRLDADNMERPLFTPVIVGPLYPLPLTLKNQISVWVQSRGQVEFHRGFFSSSMAVSAWLPSAVHKSPELSTE